MNKGYIFQKTRKNSIAMLAWASVLFVLYLMYVVSAFIYIPNAYSSGYSLDTADLFSKIETVTIEKKTEPFPTSEYGVTIPPCIRRYELYEDGLKYRFKYTIESYKDVGIGYNLNEDKSLHILYGTPKTGLVPPTALQKVGLITMGGVNFVALLPRATEIKAGDIVEYAIFTELPMYIGHDLGLTEYAGIEVSTYVADLRNLVVEDETTDFVLIVFFTLIFPTFLAYCILCLINPKKFHTNYMRIAKFGDIDIICAQIDVELTEKTAYKEKRSIYTTHYIIEQTWYTTKVRKNHLLRH